MNTDFVESGTGELASPHIILRLRPAHTRRVPRCQACEL